MKTEEYNIGTTDSIREKIGNNNYVFTHLSNSVSNHIELHMLIFESIRLEYKLPINSTIEDIRKERDKMLGDVFDNLFPMFKIK